MTDMTNWMENAVLDAVFNNTALQKSARYIQLHTGDPGEDGTANVATEDTRQSITGAAASGGTFTSTNALTWTGVAATETYTHVSIWDASGVGAGNCMLKGVMDSPQPVTVGNNFTLAAGDLIVTMN